MRHAALAVAATTALLIGLLAFAGFAQADDTAWLLLTSARCRLLTTTS